MGALSKRQKEELEKQPQTHKSNIYSLQLKEIQKFVDSTHHLPTGLATQPAPAPDSHSYSSPLIQSHKNLDDPPRTPLGNSLGSRK